MKLGLKLMPVVGPDRVNPKRELRDHMIGEVDGARLSVSLVYL
jgi:hypothetical protein